MIPETLTTRYEALDVLTRMRLQQARQNVIDSLARYVAEWERLADRYDATGAVENAKLCRRKAKNLRHCMNEDDE